MMSSRISAAVCGPGRASVVARLGASPTAVRALFRVVAPTNDHTRDFRRASVATSAAAGSGSGATAAPAGSGNATAELADAFQRLQGITVQRVSDQQSVEITSLWGADERAVLAFGRHMG